jgi:hypothetical protein
MTEIRYYVMTDNQHVTAATVTQGTIKQLLETVLSIELSLCWREPAVILQSDVLLTISVLHLVRALLQRISEYNSEVTQAECTMEFTPVTNKIVILCAELYWITKYHKE